MNSVISDVVVGVILASFAMLVGFIDWKIFDLFKEFKKDNEKMAQQLRDQEKELIELKKDVEMLGKATISINEKQNEEYEWNNLMHSFEPYLMKEIAGKELTEDEKRDQERIKQKIAEHIDEVDKKFTKRKRN